MVPRMKPLLLAVLLVLPLVAEAQVYRCGNSYQPEPCGDDAARITQDNLTTYQAPEIHQRPIQPIPRQSRQVQQRQRQANRPSQYQSTTERRNAEARAHREGRLLVGMTENRALAILGNPDNYNRHRHTRQGCKTYYWSNVRFNNSRHAARLCDGVVVSYSSR